MENCILLHNCEGSVGRLRDDAKELKNPAHKAFWMAFWDFGLSPEIGAGGNEEF